MPIDKEWVINKTNEIIYNRFGMNIGPGEPQLQSEIRGGKERHYWIVPLEVDYPRIIEDQSTRTRRYVVFHLGKLSEVKFDADRGEPLELPARTFLSNSVQKELVRIRDRVERLMVRTASYNLARLVSLKHMMSPLSNLVTTSLRRGSYLLPDELSTRRSKIQKYVDLLVNRGLLIFDQGIVEPSPTLWELYDRLQKDYSGVIEHALKDIIENSYDTLYETHNIRILHPYIQISSSYYDYALSAQDLVAMSEDDLWEAYWGLYKTYSERRRFRFDDYLRELSQEGVDILVEAGKGAWKGSEDIFERMQKDFSIEKTAIVAI